MINKIAVAETHAECLTGFATLSYISGDDRILSQYASHSSMPTRPSSRRPADRASPSQKRRDCSRIWFVCSEFSAPPGVDPARRALVRPRLSIRRECAPPPAPQAGSTRNSRRTKAYSPCAVERRARQDRHLRGPRAHGWQAVDSPGLFDTGCHALLFFETRGRGGESLFWHGQGGGRVCRALLVDQPG